MSKRIWPIVAVAAAIVVWFVWFRSPAGQPAEAGAAHLDEVANQIWITDLPENPKDKIDVFLMIEHPGFGQFLTTSAYEGDYAVFEWKESRDGIGIVFPQTGKKHRLSFKVDHEGCFPFDLCMTVKGAPRGAKRYVSMEDWVIEGSPDQALGTVRALLARESAAPN